MILVHLEAVDAGDAPHGDGEGRAGLGELAGSLRQGFIDLQLLRSDRLDNVSAPLFGQSRGRKLTSGDGD